MSQITKEEFIVYLEEGTEDRETKLNCLQYFIDNYPVLVDEVIKTPIATFKTGKKYWTKLYVNLKEIPPRDINNDFKKLQIRLKEMKEWDTEEN